MIEDWTSRTELLLGGEALQKLKKAHVLIIGVGGVGAYAAEAICRAGIGKLTIVDADEVSVSNINRQLVAIHSTLGKSKVEVLAERLKDINPQLELETKNEFVVGNRTLELLEEENYDFVVDAIDTLSPKVFLLYHAYQKGLKIASSMGAGGKMDPSRIAITDLSKSKNCKLAKTVRKKLGRMGVRKGIMVVYSDEEVPESAVRECRDEQNKKSIVGTISYIPAIFGLQLASIVILDLIGETKG